MRLHSEDIRRNILLEMAMSIGGEFDLDILLGNCLPIFLRKLNCTLAGVVQVEGNAWKTIKVLPSIMLRMPQWEQVATSFSGVHIQNADACPKLISDNSRFYGFCLKDFGLLILGRSLEFDSAFERELMPVVDLLARACRAGLEAQRRQEAEQTLLLAQAQQKALLDNLPFLAWMKDAQGRYLAVNEVFVRECGHPVKDILGKTARDVWPDPLAGKFIQQDAQVLGSGKKMHSEQMLEGTGEDRWSEFFKTPVLGPEGEIIGLAGFMRDITAVKQAERKLLAHAELESLLAAVSLRFINLGVEDIDQAIQVSLGEIGGLLDVDRVYVFQYGPERQFWSNTYEWCASGIASQIDNLQDIPADLTPWWQDTLLRFASIVIPDVSALPREAKPEQDILEAQDIKSLLVVPMIWDNTLEGFIGFDSVRKHCAWEIRDAVPLEMLASILINALKRKDAEQRLLQSQMLLQELNVSLEEKVEERTRQLGETQRQLILGEKMAAIGQLAAGIAHELNNPVGFVAMNFQALEEYLPVIINVLDGYKQAVKAPPGTVEQDALLEQVIRLEQDASLDFMLQDISKLMEQSQEGVRRMTSIINSMRDFSRSDRHEEFVSTDLNKGLRDTLMICRNTYKHHAEVVSELGDIPNVECIPGQINQVFLNIIVNAAQALAEADLPEKGTIRITTRSASPNVICEIFNNGPGIPEAIRGRIFEAFFTTKPPGKGTGLGLSISHDIVVRTHKGSLTVESDAHHGTTFRISLPIKQARDNSQREG